MADKFKGSATGLDSPAKNAAAVTPHDTNELAAYSRALWVGTGGTLVVVLANDSAAVTLKSIGSGTLLPVRAKIVKATGTTAADIVALW